MPRKRSLASRRASIAAHMLHAKRDARETTRAGRTAFMQRFYDQVDPDGVLPAEERERRAGHARAAYFRKLALRRSQAIPR